MIAINFAFFWSTNFKERYFLHLLPLMLVLGWMEFGPVVRSIVLPRPTRRIVVAVLATFFVVYPLAQGLERAWRDPHAFLGRRLAVRFLDYPTVMAQIESHVPEDAVVMTHLGHEIAWYTRRKTVFPPGDPADFEYLANRFDVQAFYRHPDVAFDASALAGFAPVPGTDDLLWLKVAR